MVEIELSVEKLSQILGDEYYVKILTATASTPKNALQLSEEHDIPLAVCYRKIKYLETEGLLVGIDNMIGEKGKKTKKYLSQLKGASITLQDGRIMTKLWS